MSKIPNYRDPRAQLEGLLTATHQLWGRLTDGPELPRDDRAKLIGQMCSHFSAAWYLRALMTEVPEQAGKVCETLQDILNDGGGLGEWTWDLLVEAGVDPATIAPAEPEPQPTEFLIWSHHHQMWWGANGSGYRGQIVDAGRYSLEAAQKELGRGCGCCAVPEVVIPAPSPEVFARAGRVGEWATKTIKEATKARFDEGKINRHATVQVVPSETPGVNRD